MSTFRSSAKLLILCCSYLPAVCLNAEITTIQSLNFGTIVVTNNNFQSSVIIDPVGNVQIIGGIAVIESGNHAVYQLSDLPPNTVITPNIQVINSQMIANISSEETFRLTLLPNQNTLISDSNGSATLTLGGRIDSSGNGSIRFSDTDYESTIQITINY
jgi:hypothetical protein